MDNTGNVVDNVGNANVREKNGHVHFLPADNYNYISHFDGVLRLLRGVSCPATKHK